MPERLSACNTSLVLFKIVASALFLQLLASMPLSNGNIFSLGHGFGKSLRERDDDLDLKDLDQEIDEFAESLGSDQRIVGKLVNDDFREGVQHGYYAEEYEEELVDEVGGEVKKYTR
jgi:hypothetical protein